MPGIFDRADFRTRINTHVIELDWDSKIDPNLAHGLAQIGERTFRILAGIAHDNVMASPKHHLVKAEIFEMPAIGEINVRIGIVC